jgi:hypothetical protein
MKRSSTPLRAAGAALLLAVTLGACQDLDIANPNAADRARALNNPGDVEALIASAWIPYWNRTQVQGNPYHSLNALSGVMNTSVADNGALYLSDIPRPIYDNNPTSEVSGVARFQWYEYYNGLDSANEGLRAIDGGLKIITPERSGGAVQDNTTRARAFAKFSQGLMLGYISMLFDQGLIVTEDDDLEDPATLTPRPWQEVRDAAVSLMMEAVQISQGSSFIVPPEWITNLTITNDEFARLAYSYAARFLVLSARYPEDRDDVDWARVIEFTEKGITQDFVIPHEVGKLGNSNYKRRISFDVFNGFRIDPGFLGFIDTSGAFQEWRDTPLLDRQRFHISTTDRRFTGSTPTSNGLYVRYRSTNPFRDERGTWRQSYYQFFRWRGEWQNADLTVMTVDEMNLLRAEAYARTGRTQDAAELANRTRVAHGQLPPLTAQGVPQSDDCVPRTYEGQCMGLIDAIIYERIVEGMGLEAPRDWMEMRGWGKLVPGTFVHFPIPGRELETLGLPIYHVGGGLDGSAR